MQNAKDAWYYFILSSLFWVDLATRQKIYNMNKVPIEGLLAYLIKCLGQYWTKLLSDIFHTCFENLIFKEKSVCPKPKVLRLREDPFVSFLFDINDLNKA